MLPVSLNKKDDVYKLLLHTRHAGQLDAAGPSSKLDGQGLKELDFNKDTS